MVENIEDLILPEVPKELAQQFNLLEQKFVRAEVDQSELLFLSSFLYG